MNSCFERTPYVSLIAAILVLTGSGLMCGTNYEALRRAKNVFEERFYPIHGTRTLQIIGIVQSVATMIFGIVNVSFGAVVTGQTRQRFYAHKKSQASGRTYSRFLLAVTYLVALIWVGLFIAFAIPVTLWVMLHVVCREETSYWRSISADKDETRFTYNFNLTQYGVYRRPLDTSLYSEHVNSPSAFTQLCQEVSTVGPLFTIAILASFLVILGLVIFVACLSSASVRLEFAAEVDRIRRFPNQSEEFAMPLLTAQQHQQRSSTFRSGMETQSNIVPFVETTSNLRYQGVPHPSAVQVLPVSPEDVRHATYRHTPVHP